jgi:hypothetical protein
LFVTDPAVYTIAALVVKPAPIVVKIVATLTIGVGVRYGSPRAASFTEAKRDI